MQIYSSLFEIEKETKVLGLELGCIKKLLSFEMDIENKFIRDTFDLATYLMADSS
jgi:hypothetical protein